MGSFLVKLTLMVLSGPPKATMISNVLGMVDSRTFGIRTGVVNE